MRILFCFIIVCFCAVADCAVLHGYGEVEGCYKFPDKTIPTCDGAAYISVDWWENYCYIPSLGCNMLVVVEGVASYDKPDEYAKLYEAVVPIDKDEYESGTYTYIYCRMTYPYVGYYVSLDGEIPFLQPGDEIGHCGGLFYDTDSYNCYQNPADADDPCWDDFWQVAFWDAEQEEVFLSALFTEIVSESPCDIGISKLMTSTGWGFQLYAEKYTEPSLVVSYNDQKCYGKLEQGNVAGAVNINYNGVVYHTVQ